MFRKMRRIKQQISEEECLEILRQEPRGVLSVLGDDGYPYGMPLNHWYSDKDGKLYFHGGRGGHRTDAVNACDKVCYCVYDQRYRREGEWALNIRSVIVFGRMRFVTDEEKIREICTNLTGKFTDDRNYLEEELKKDLSRTLCLELVPEYMTGKLVNEA